MASRVDLPIAGAGEQARAAGPGGWWRNRSSARTPRSSRGPSRARAGGRGRRGADRARRGSGRQRPAPSSGRPSGSITRPSQASVGASHPTSASAKPAVAAHRQQRDGAGAEPVERPERQSAAPGRRGTRRPPPGTGSAAPARGCSSRRLAHGEVARQAGDLRHQAGQAGDRARSGAAAQRRASGPVQGRTGQRDSCVPIRRNEITMCHYRCAFLFGPRRSRQLASNALFS